MLEKGLKFNIKKLPQFNFMVVKFSFPWLSITLNNFCKSVHRAVQHNDHSNLIKELDGCLAI